MAGPKTMVDNLSENSNLILVQAQSAGFDGENFAQIFVNNVAVATGNNENNHQRGLHIAVINPMNGKVVRAKVFDTYQSSATFETFISIMDVNIFNIEEGSIIVAAAKDDCVKSLSAASKKWFMDMGSQAINNVDYRQSFTFMGIYGRKQCHEKVGTNNATSQLTWVFRTTNEIEDSEKASIEAVMVPTDTDKQEISEHSLTEFSKDMESAKNFIVEQFKSEL